MASGSPSFVVTLPLKTTPADERACAIALDAARQIYNAVLGEALRRLDLMRQSQEFAAARLMPKGAPSSKERKARAAEFNRLRETFDLTPGSLQRFAQSCRDQCWIGDHLPGHCCQTAATRAFKTRLTPSAFVGARNSGAKTTSTRSRARSRSPPSFGMMAPFGSPAWSFRRSSILRMRGKSKR